jgi:monovalent cation/hydrogen antiporter
LNEVVEISGKVRGRRAKTSSTERLCRELLDAERRAVLELGRSGRIDDEVMRRVVRDLDLEDARLEV